MDVESESAAESRCPVTRGELDVDRYERLDGQWRAMKLPAPAHRALVDADILTVEDLRATNLRHLAALHGMGPKALDILRPLVE